MSQIPFLLTIAVLNDLFELKMGAFCLSESSYITCIINGITILTIVSFFHLDDNSICFSDDLSQRKAKLPGY